MPIGISEIATLATVVIGGVTDLRTGKIYNALTYPAIALGVFLSFVTREPDWRSSLFGLLVAFAPFAIFWANGWMGGGDAKLMAAVGALRGYPFILHAMFYSIFVGAIAASLVLIWKSEFVASWKDVGQRVGTVFRPGAPIPPLPPRGGVCPFGVAICVGTLIATTLEALQGQRPLEMYFPFF